MSLEKNYIVKLKNAKSLYTIKNKIKSKKAKVKKHIKDIDLLVIEDADDDLIKELEADKTVEFVEVDELVAPDDFIPNDPSYANQWHLPKIQMPKAWELSKGKDVIVAVLDTGVDLAHKEFVGKIIPGINTYANNNVLTDVYGHGTKVIGVIVALTNNAQGIASVAPDAKVLAIRVSRDDGYALYSDIAEGVTYAANNKAKIASISFAGVNGSSSIKSAAQYLKSKGGLTVTAAGNLGRLDTTPASDHLIAVSATTSTDTRPSFSSFGDYVDISAPGNNIYTTAKGNNYTSISGTSFSAPIVAGVLALMMSARSGLKAQVYEQVLFNSVDDLGAVGKDQYFGHGRVNAFKAVQNIINY